MPNQALKSLPEATGGVPVEIWSAPRGPIANLAHGFGKKVVTRRRIFFVFVFAIWRITGIAKNHVPWEIEWV